MATRPFAQIDCTLPKSKKLRACRDSNSRWVYCCVHLSELGNFSGLFRYPRLVWADDACLSLGELDDAIADLEANNLVEYDRDEEFVRIVAWFHKRNAPENASRMQSLIHDLRARDHDNDGMFVRSVSEFTVGSIRRAQGWKPDSTEWSKMREAFKPFLRHLMQDYGDAFLEALAEEVSRTSKATKAEIHSLLPAFAEWRRAPCPHPGHTVTAHVNETRRIQDEEKEKDEKDTAKCSRFEDAESDATAERSDMPRKDAGGDRPTPKSGPLDVTKRSALATGTKL